MRGIDLSELWLAEPLGERPLAPSDLPLTVGGPGAAIVIPGCTAGEIRARVNVAGDILRVTPEAGQPTKLEGVGFALETHDGRRTIVVRHSGVANVTRPPEFEGGAFESAGAEGSRLPISIVAYEPRRADGAQVTRAPRNWHKAALWAAAAVALLALWFMMSMTTVLIATTPTADLADVEFNGTLFDFGFNGSYLVPPGQYELQVEAKGYLPARMPLTVASTAQQRIVVALERLPGVVTFETGGIAATLAVDGVARGKLPGEYELAAGTRELLIQAPHYAEERVRLEVVGGGERQTLQTKFVPLFAKVTVASVPAGATVLVDDREIGRTPLATELDAGHYALAIVHPQFRRFESPITVRAGEPLAIGPVELGRPDGTLVVRSNPAGADVSIGGRYRGRTPLSVAVAPGLSQEVLVARMGYAPVTQMVSVESATERAISLNLKPVLGEIRVHGDPADAVLFVDGASRGPANQVLSLPAAPHLIEVRKAGLESFKATVTPQSGAPQLIEYALKSAGEAHVAGLAAQRTTSLGQELVLVRGGRYTMGSPRREPGRRSNETERVVELKRPFYIARHQVTNKEFREFRAEHMSGIFKEESLDLDRQPVARVSWQDAVAFCNWLSGRDKLPPAYERNGDQLVLVDPVTTGYRLPSEAEWEFAARNDGRQAIRKYPWGDNLPMPAHVGNWADTTAIYTSPVTITGYNDGYKVAAPVETFPANPLGLFDMGSNVFEWMTDRYSIYVVGPDHVSTDPVGPRAGDSFVIRGASWLTGRIPDLRLAARDSANNVRPDLGFRIARYAE